MVSACASCASGSSGVTASSLRAYVAAVEPIRLGVNRLLGQADPILNAYHDHQMSGDEAATAMDRLERTFAEATVAIAEVRAPGELTALNTPYAHTFVQEDAYLSTLVSDLPDGNFDNLPATQSEQRAAIIAWRTQLQVLADRLHVALPADLQQAGRGEIAPAPTGS